MEQDDKFKNFLKTIRLHRKENNWDVVYNPKIDLTVFENAILTDIPNTTKSKNIVNNKNISIEKNDLRHDDASPDKSLFIQEVKFDSCDFSGSNLGKKITIKNCEFHLCYFSFSRFNDVNFVNCKFNSCSFSQSRFYRCIFDENCKFYNLSISGSSTKFEDTEINAISFFKKTYEAFNEKPESYKDLNLPEEEYRLAKSIVKLSRNILASTQSCSNDDFYYSSLKNLCLKKINEKKYYNLKRIATLSSNIEEKKVECKTTESKEIWYILTSSFKVKCLKARQHTYHIEKIIVKLFGFMNNWGGSIQRVLAIGFAILMAYSVLYFVMDKGWVNYATDTEGVKIAHVHTESIYFFFSSLIKSFDITFLAGYTKHISNHDSLFKQYVLLSNMLIGLFWYAVAIPSLINKISVTRL